MPLRLRLTGTPSLTPLCHDLKDLADDKYHANELRSNGRTLYVKLRSACCMASRESARNEHRRSAAAWVGAALAADLTELGASALKDRLLGQFLPAGSAGRPGPVRVADVLDLKRVLDRARKLATTVPGLAAVNLAAASVLQTRAQAGAEPSTSTWHGITPPGSISKSRTSSESVSMPPTRSRAGTSVGARVPQPTALEQRAADYLAHAERLANPPPPRAGLPDHPSMRSDEFLALATSFPVSDLLTPGELRLHASFLAQARPLLDAVAPSWQSMGVHELMHFVQRLMNMHRTVYGYEAVEVRFERSLDDVAALSADGAHVALPIGQSETLDHLDVFVHHLVYGLALRYQHHLADAMDSADGSDRALASILRANRLVPMDRSHLVRQFGMRRPAARQAWQASASHRHATALADLVAASAYAALSNDASRLPRMARLGKRR